MQLTRYHIMIDTVSSQCCCELKSRIPNLLLKHKATSFKFDFALDANKDSVNTLLEVIRHNYPKVNATNCDIELHINPNDIDQYQLSLPTMALSEHELSLFVDAHVAKLTNNAKPALSNDYVVNLSHQHILEVGICEFASVQKWQQLFSALSIPVTFIGCVIDNQKRFNFLPWRLLKRQKQKRHLTLTLIIYLLAMSFTLSYWWWSASVTFSQYTQMITDLGHHEPTVGEEDNPADTRIAYRQPIRPFLLLISEKTPRNIVLDALDYSPENITLYGHSLSPSAITQFSEILSQDTLIKHNQIKQISAEHNHFLFNMDIVLNAY